MNKQRERRIERLETAFGKKPPSKSITWQEFLHMYRFTIGFDLLWPQGEGAPELAIREYDRIVAELNRLFPKPDPAEAEARRQRELEEAKRAEEEAKRREEQSLRRAEETRLQNEEQQKRREQEEIRNREDERLRLELLEQKRREENKRRCLEELTRSSEEAARRWPYR